MNLENNKIVLLANGNFPLHQKPLEILNNSDIIICCDGASTNAINHGYTPNLIIGDLDSIKKGIIELYEIKMINLPNQNENDLRKSLLWIAEHNGQAVDILGATGKRDDHSIANIFSICQMDIDLTMKITTDYGVFMPLTNKTVIKTFRNQKISLFCTSNKTKITADNLKYPLNEMRFNTLYEGSLNFATKDKLDILVENGTALIFLAHKGIDDGK